MVSRLAEVWRHNMRQTCTLHRYAGADPSGQPIYGDGVEYPCRLAIRTERTFSADGDYITNSTVQIVLPADCPVQAYDIIDLPSDYQQGAIIREVITGTDQWGEVTHKAVRIA